MSVIDDLLNNSKQAFSGLVSNLVSTGSSVQKAIQNNPDVQNLAGNVSNYIQNTKQDFNVATNPKTRVMDSRLMLTPFTHVVASAKKLPTPIQNIADANYSGKGPDLMNAIPPVGALNTIGVKTPKFTLGDLGNILKSFAFGDTKETRAILDTYKKLKSNIPVSDAEMKQLNDFADRQMINFVASTSGDMKSVSGADVGGAYIKDPKTGEMVYNFKKAMQTDVPNYESMIAQEPNNPMNVEFKNNLEKDYLQSLQQNNPDVFAKVGGQDRLNQLLNPQGTPPNSTNLSDIMKNESGGMVPGAEVGGPTNPNGEQKGLLGTVQNSTNASPELQKVAGDITPQTYTPITNEQSLAAADTRIAASPVDARSFVLDTTQPLSADKAATFYKLIQKASSEGNISEAQTLLDAADQQGRAGGQFNQIASMWTALDPENLSKIASDVAGKHGITFDSATKDAITEQMMEVQALPDGPEKVAATSNILNFIANKIPPTAGELFNNYRYMNMLSSPATVGKITASGLFNTMVTRPVDIFSEATVQHAHELMDSNFQRTVSYSDIPEWYKNVYLGLPDAWQAAISGWSNPASNIADTGTPDAGAIEAARRSTSLDAPTLAGKAQAIENIPGKTHGFVYNYFKSLIAGGEQSRLMANGVDAQEAAQAGQNLADKLTLRSKLGSNSDTFTPEAVKAVDSIGSFAEDMRSKGGAVGTFSNWIAPFMKISTNFAKLGVEHSPLSLPDSALATMQGQPGADDALAHAMVGSVIAGASAMMASKDQITLDAPTDKKLSDAFYASGRKPYSINIPGVGWTPIQYFGPLGLSLMLPQAIREATSGVNGSKNGFQKIVKSGTNITKSIIAGTPLPTITGFFSLLNGDTSVNPETMMADLSSQVIPLEAMQRYIANIVDPIYRHAGNYGERLKTGIPFLSKDVPPFTLPNGKPETRNITNYVLPYAIGQPNAAYEPAYQQRQTTLEENAKALAAKKASGTTAGPQAVKPKASTAKIKRTKSKTI